MIAIAKPLIGPEEEAAALAVLRSGGLAQGPEVAAFEHEFSALAGGGHCVAVNSGTSALHVALLAAGIGPGDEVIVPSFTFAATANAVRLAGAEPVFADIDLATFTLDPAAVAAAMTPRTAAMIPVHLYGQCAPMPALVALAERHGLFVLEDAAQAHGAALDGRPAGGWGGGAAFSFYPTKNMTTGEGGMVVLADEAMARTARLLRNQGMERQYDNEIVGFNLRMTDVAAAIGRVQLGRLPAFNTARRAHAARLDEALGAIPGIQTPVVAPGATHVYHQYTLTVASGRDAVAERVQSAGVDAKVYYPVPVHRLPAFRVTADLPATERAAASVLSVPAGPHLTGAQVEQVAAAVAEAVSAVAA